MDTESDYILNTFIESLVKSLINSMGLTLPPEELEPFKIHLREEFRLSIMPQPRHRGSVPGRRYIRRQHGEGHIRLMADYFDEDPKYPPEVFRRRFRMDRRLFLRIADDLSSR
jgi:hypothetical protein